MADRLEDLDRQAKKSFESSGLRSVRGLSYHFFLRAGIAQLVEQRTENPRVTSSSLVPGIQAPSSDEGSHGGLFSEVQSYQVYLACLMVTLYCVVEDKPTPRLHKRSLTHRDRDQ